MLHASAEALTARALPSKVAVFTRRLARMARKKPQSRSVDVARLAGVSRSAVSRAFTLGAFIAPETRRKVLDAAAMLGYSPNAIARSLITQRTNIIGVVTTDLRNPFHAALLQEIGDLLQAKGFASLLMIAGRDNLDSLVPKLLSYQVDGFILTAVMLSSTMAARCDEIGKPVVLVDRYIESDTITSISSDNLGGGAEVADFLIDGDHQRIAFMAGVRETSSSRDRERGFRDRLAERGRRLYATDCGDYDPHESATAARRLLSMTPRPDAIFCANDVMAMATVDVARNEFGLEVPSDLSVVGYDNVAASLHYGLTTVGQDVHQMAIQATTALFNRLGSAALPTERQTVASHLVVRDSARPRSIFTPVA
jgi:DNA-binding LacI/PurR family transcriptional regulator